MVLRSYSEEGDHLPGWSFLKNGEGDAHPPAARIQISGRTLVQKSDLFADNLALITSPYTLKSQVSFGSFQNFVAAVEGKAVTIKNENFSGLSRPCDEFRLRELGCGFRNFGNLGILRKRQCRCRPLKR
jgi:hypothetical protein